jgi:type VI secretion system protein ImpG
MDNNRLYEYYVKTLEDLRDRSQDFAKKYPKVAGYLDMSRQSSADPHVERLLESFAYLTGRLKKDLDDQFPRLTANLLKVLYPHLCQPLPSCTILQFQTPHDGYPLVKNTIPKSTEVFSHGEKGDVYRFLTSSAVELGSLHIGSTKVLPSHHVTGEELSDVAYLQLEVSRHQGDNQDPPSYLRCHIYGEGNDPFNFYEALISHDRPVLYRTSHKSRPFVMCEKAYPVGFHQDEGLFPYPQNGHDMYRLLHEFFYFPKKFLFFDIKGWEKLGDFSRAYIYLPLKGHHENPSFSRSTILTGCVPAINLFSKLSQPIRMDHRQVSYLLNPDCQQQKNLEIHRIEKVEAIGENRRVHYHYQPYFSYNHHDDVYRKGLFWVTERSIQETDEKYKAFENVHISFINIHENHQLPEPQTAFAHLWCCHRDLHEKITVNTTFHNDDLHGALKIKCLYRPTPMVYPPRDGETQWRLISHLSLSHLSFIHHNDQLSVLKETLTLYGPWNQGHFLENLLDHIKGIHIYTISRRLGDDAWRGFVKGVSVDLTLSSEPSHSGFMFLLCHILHHFFAGYIHGNSFSSLAILDQKQKEIYRWEPTLGQKPLV